jgi:hypothetical protein
MIKMTSFSKLALLSVFSLAMFACAPETTVTPASPTPSVAPSTVPSVSPSTTPSTTPSPSTDKKDDAKLGEKSSVKLVDYEWTKYNLKFTLPSDLKVAKNEEGEFEANNESMNVQIFPWKDAKLTKDDVLVEAFKGLTNIDKSSFVIDDNFSGEITNLNGFKGYVVGGTAKQDGTDVYLGVLVLIDPNGSDNYISYVVFNKGKSSEDDKNLNIGGDIFASFKKG